MPILSCSLSYRSMLNIVNTSGTSEIYYFILKTTTGKFKIQKPEACKIQLKTNFNGFEYLNFSYKTKTNNWSSVTSTSFKNNAYYFKTLKEAEDAFEKHIKYAKEHFTNQINNANIALTQLNSF